MSRELPTLSRPYDEQIGLMLYQIDGIQPDSSKHFIGIYGSIHGRWFDLGKRNQKTTGLDDLLMEVFIRHLLGDHPIELEFPGKDLSLTCCWRSSSLPAKEITVGVVSGVRANSKKQKVHVSQFCKLDAVLRQLRDHLSKGAVEKKVPKALLNPLSEKRVEQPVL